MKVAFKSIVAAAACLCTAMVSAATVTVVTNNTTYKGYRVSGDATVTFSPKAISAFNGFRATFGTVGQTALTTTVDATGKYASVGFTSNLGSLAVDDVGDLVQAATTTGGLTWSVPTSAASPLGGSVSLTDLEVNLVDQQVYATFSGTNGVGPIARVPLWRIATVSGSQALAPAGTTFTASGLSLTPEARETLGQALGTNWVGTQVLSSVSDYGTLSVTTAATAVPLTPCAVNFNTTPATSSTPYFATQVTVRNFTSNPATGWQVNWRFAERTLLTSVKNARLSNKGFRDHTALPVAANATVPASGTATFSYRGYSASRASAISELTATLSGLTCVVTAQ
jgi:Cellulose binding domain